MRKLTTMLAIAIVALLLGYVQSWAQPTLQARYVTFTNVTATTATINWVNGNGDGRLVAIVKRDSWESDEYPSNNTLYNPTANISVSCDESGSDRNTWECGSYYSPAYRVVYVGTGSTRSVNISGLTKNSRYAVKVFEFNGTASNPIFNTSSSTMNPRTFDTDDEPVYPPTNISFAGTSDGALLTYSDVTGLSTSNGNYWGYFVDVFNKNTDDFVYSQVDIGDPNNNEYPINGLLPNQTGVYQGRMSTYYYDDGGDSGDEYIHSLWSSWVQFNTIGSIEICSTTYSPSGGQVTSGTITVTVTTCPKQIYLTATEATINGKDVVGTFTETSTLGRYTFTYTRASCDPYIHDSWNLPVTLTLQDVNGNATTQVITPFTNNASVAPGVQSTLSNGTGSAYAYAYNEGPYCYGSTATLKAYVVGNPASTNPYTWKNAQSQIVGYGATFNIDGLAVGSHTYTLEVRSNTTSSCSTQVNTYQTTVVVNPVPAITLGNAPYVCGSETTATFVYTNAVNTPTHYKINFDSEEITDVEWTSMSNGITAAIPINLATGPYTGLLTIKNEFCEEEYEVTVYKNVSIPVSIETEGTVGCLATMSVVPESTIVDPVYKWYRNGTLLSDATESELTVYQNGEYYAVVSGTNSCPYTSNTLDINLEGLEAAELLDENDNLIEGSIDFCTSGTIYANPSDKEYDYLWMKDFDIIDGETGSSLFIDEPGSADYRVIISAPGCDYEISDRITVNVYTPPTSYITSLSYNLDEERVVACDSAFLDANSDGTNLTYQWYKMSEINDSRRDGGLINQDILLTGETNSTLKVTDIGYYRVYIEDEHCGTYSDYIYTYVTPTPDASIGSEDISGPDQVTACGETYLYHYAPTIREERGGQEPQFEYTWYKLYVTEYYLIENETSNTLHVTSTGSYKLNVKNIETSCEELSDPMIVVINPLPGLVISNQPAACLGQTTASINYSVTSNNPTTYKIEFEDENWTDIGWSTLPINNIPFSFPSNAIPGEYNATLWVKNSNGCLSEPIEFTVNVVLVPAHITSVDYDYQAAKTIGCGQTILDANNIGGREESRREGNYSYQWYQLVNNDYVAMNGKTSSTLTVTVDGFYKVKVTDDDNGCYSMSDAMEVVINPLPTITFGTTPAEACYGSSTISIPYTGTTQNPLTYSIDFTNPAITDVVNATLTSSPIVVNLPETLTAGTHTAIVTVKNANTCVSMNTNLSFVINPLPTNTITGKAKAKNNFNLTFTSDQTMVSYNWTATGNPTIVNATNKTVTMNWANIGEYVVTLTYTDSKGCTNTKTHNIEIINVAPKFANCGEWDGIQYVTLTFDKGLYTNDNMTGALVPGDFGAIFTQNGGTASNIAITSVNHTAGSNTAILTMLVTGTSTGCEFFRIAPVANQIYDEYGIRMETPDIEPANISCEFYLPNLTEPTMSPSNLTFTGVSSTSLSYSWTNGNGTHRIIVMKEGSAPTFVPVDNTIYTVGNTYGDAKIVYYGNGSSSSISDLTAGSTYYFAVYSANSFCQNKINYKTSSPATGNAQTLAPADRFKITEINGVSVPNNDGYVFVQSGTTLTVKIATYFNTIPATVNVQEDVVLSVDGTPVPVTLSIGNNTSTISPTQYSVTLEGVTLEDGGNGGRFTLKVDDGNGGNNLISDSYLIKVRALEPTSTEQSRSIIFTEVKNNTVTFGWTPGKNNANYGRILIVREAANTLLTNQLPVDGVVYGVGQTSPVSFVSDGVNINDAKIMYQTNGASSVNNVQITNLTPSTQYHFRLFEYRYQPTVNESYNYRHATASANPRTTTLPSKDKTGNGINLTNYTGKSYDGIVNLDWQTSFEKGIFGFELYRMDVTNDGAFELVSSYNTDQNLVSMNKAFSYNTIDNNNLVVGNEYIYKLTAVTFDGTRIELGEELVVVNTMPNTANTIFVEEINPNPVKDELKVNFQLAKSIPVSIQVRDISGKLIGTIADMKEFSAGAHTVSLNMNGNAAGSYILTVVAGMEVTYQQFIYMP